MAPLPVSPVHNRVTRPDPAAMLPVMTILRRQPVMTRAQFFDWAQAQDMRYEFDGFAPVAMTGGSLKHSQICQNLWFALRRRLSGTGCRPLGPDAGVATIGDAVRYPDALVTCTRITGEEYLTPGVIVVFEVLSPTSGRIDRIVKVQEYAVVPSILRYVIVESSGIGLTVLERTTADQKWTVTTLLAAEDALALPEIGITFPVAELYEEVDPPEA